MNAGYAAFVESLRARLGTIAPRRHASAQDDERNRPLGGTARGVHAGVRARPLDAAPSVGSG